MSSIYISEPPTKGKVILTTTVGDLDVELWSKETPKACRNFVQLCLEGYYEGCEFFRVVPRFIVQTGDPTNTGTGGDSIYDEPFKDEFHTRLKFNRRGLVGMANTGVANDNRSQFFITLDKSEELTKKHTLFAKITGDSVFNLLKIGEVETNNDEKPIYPIKILKAEVLDNPFPDITVRQNSKIKQKQEEEARLLAKQQQEEEEKKRKAKIGAKKDIKLLSFGADEEESADNESQFNKIKIKSSHDVLKNDSRLRPAEPVEMETTAKASNKRTISDRDKSELEQVSSTAKLVSNHQEKNENEANESDLEDDAPKKKVHLEPLKKSAEEKLLELKEQSRKLAEELKKSKSNKTTATPVAATTSTTTAKDEKEKELDNEYEMTAAKYKEGAAKKLSPAEREAQMLAMLEGFKKKLSSKQSLPQTSSSSSSSSSLATAANAESSNESPTDNPSKDWLYHKLQFEEDANKKLVVDPSKENDEGAIFNERNEKVVLGYGHSSSIKIQHSSKSHHHPHHHHHHGGSSSSSSRHHESRSNGGRSESYHRK